MRNLTQDEVLEISGGVNTEGYNFSFIVENSVSGACIGLFFAVLSSDPNCILISAGLFGGYATLMMFTKALDNYVFNDMSVESQTTIEIPA